MPVDENEEKRCLENKKNPSKLKTTIANMLILPQVVCIVMFVIVACIIEKRRLQLDPLNFSMLNIIFEVVRYIQFFLSAIILSIFLSFTLVNLHGW